MTHKCLKVGDFFPQMYEDCIKMLDHQYGFCDLSLFQHIFSHNFTICLSVTHWK